jgi:phenylacetaldehyde dehydrogenase
MTVAMNDLSTIRPATRAFLGADHQNFIDGQWCPAISGKTLEVLDPSTGKAISQVPDSEMADVNLAVAAARRAFEQHGWQKMKPAGRERTVSGLWQACPLK